MAQDHLDRGAPDLNLGNFHWGTTSGTPRLTEPSLGLLDYLSGKTFKGKGFNAIFRPRSQAPLDGGIQPGAAGSDNDLQLNLTEETITFTGPLGLVANRGLLAQGDIALGGISYVQTVQDVTNKETGSDDGTPVGIHFEPGVWMIVPASDLPSQGQTLNRMASIPHGTTINAQGEYPPNDGKKDGAPDIGPPRFVTPFFLQSGLPNPQPWQQVSASTNRDPLDLTKFNANGFFTQDILDNPSLILLQALEKQDIAFTITFSVSTRQTGLGPVQPVIGGGTANIGFLEGGDATTQSGQLNANANAFGASMESTFWIEIVNVNLSVAGGQPETRQQPAGEFGPTFVIPPTTGRSGTTTIPCTYTQLQYRQTVILEFGKPSQPALAWPHNSVATLGEIGEIQVQLPPQ